ncbi:MAG: EamA family transporter [Chitinophagaceae bacterium]|nr:EamA family transporter [Chitinophagaceae bacterium]
MKNTNTKAYLALLVVCIVWGTTYLALRIGVMTFPPFLFSAFRQIIAGTLLLIVLLIMKGKIVISKKDLIRQIVPGILMIALGNGVIAWSEKYIPSGLAALIVSVMPLYVILINYVVGVKKQAMNKQIIFGLLLGGVGVVLIFKDNLADLGNRAYLTGVIVAFISCFCWAAGTVYTKQRPSQANSFVNAAVQFVSGGIVLFIGSIFLDDWSQMAAVSANSLLALAYLILFGSIAAYVCYLYALKHLPSGLASVYAYINPFIAIILGFLVLNERTTWITWLAFLTTLTGVYWINKGYTKDKALHKEENEEPRGVIRDKDATKKSVYLEG